MIIVRLVGGIGNQMFQYAAGRRLAHRHGVRLKLDLSHFSRLRPSPKVARRKYALGGFRIQAQPATCWETRRLAPFHKGIARLLVPHLTSLLPRAKWKTHFEMSSRFDPAVLNLGPDVYLDGFWQNENYFSDIAEIIRSDFSLRSPLSRAGRVFEERILKTRAIGIHIRRGDYFRHPEIQKRFGILDPDYYVAAVQRVAEGIADPHFFIFSDEPQWVVQNLKLNFPSTPIIRKGPPDDCEDLYLLSLCRHFVLSNSSYGWWGAWLGRSPGKKVIAPRVWRHSPVTESKHIVPADWVMV